MKRLLAALALVAPLVHAAPPSKILGNTKLLKSEDVVSFDLANVKLGELITLAYRDAFKTPYVLSPEVAADQRVVSLRIGGDGAGKGKADFLKFLDMLGVVIEKRGGIEFLTLAKTAEVEREPFVYRPRYRDVNYLTDLLKPLFKGQFANQRGVQTAPGAGVDASKQVPPGSAAALVDKNADVLVFNGEQSEIVKLSRVLPQLDVASGEVLARAALYEVSNTKDSGSAWQLAASILSAKLSISIGTGAQVLENAVRIKSSGIDAVLSALATDSRFKVVSSPSIRVRSGAAARFSVGQEVPVLGAVTYPGSGQQPVQSVEYRPSGVIFELTPQVRDNAVDVSLLQQVSNFVNTTTGVNNSPTLIKRELKTDVSLADGDVIVLGGMTETKESGGSNGLPFLPAFMHSKTESNSRSEIILVLQLTRI